MSKINVNELKEYFYKFADEFPELLLEWRHYDGLTNQIFIWAGDEWTSEARNNLRDHLRQLKGRESKKILVARMLNTHVQPKEE